MVYFSRQHKSRPESAIPSQFPPIELPAAHRGFRSSDVDSGRIVTRNGCPDPACQGLCRMVESATGRPGCRASAIGAASGYTTRIRCRPNADHRGHLQRKASGSDRSDVLRSQARSAIGSVRRASERSVLGAVPAGNGDGACRPASARASKTRIRAQARRRVEHRRISVGSDQDHRILRLGRIGDRCRAEFRILDDAAGRQQASRRENCNTAHLS